MFFSFCLVSCNHSAPGKFILTGEIAGLADSTALTLSYFTSDGGDVMTEVKDTEYVIDGRFVFEGDLNELTVASLDFGNSYIRLFLEPAAIKLKIDKDRPWEYVLSGSETERENRKLRAKLSSCEEAFHKELRIALDIVEQMNSYGGEAPARDSLISCLMANKAEREAIGREMDNIRLDYILRHPASKITPGLIYLVAIVGSVDIDTLKNAYDQLSEESKNSISGKLASMQIGQTEMLNNGKKITTGSVAPDFSRVDISGKNLRLSDIYSQDYVLLDFWASWCEPCLKQMPRIKKIHDSYSAKGLKVIGISVDDDRTRWAEAVEKYELNGFSQILSESDPSGSDYFTEDISDAYGVEFIPCYFLIGSDGKIIARWEHLGEEEASFLKNLKPKIQPSSK